jgi:hypothetical protein
MGTGTIMTKEKFEQLKTLLQGEEDYIGHEMAGDKLKIFVKSRALALFLAEEFKDRPVEFISVLPRR